MVHELRRKDLKLLADIHKQIHTYIHTYNEYFRLDFVGLMGLSGGYDAASRYTYIHACIHEYFRLDFVHLRGLSGGYDAASRYI
jgi:hypothetical protein